MCCTIEISLSIALRLAYDDSQVGRLNQVRSGLILYIMGAFKYRHVGACHPNGKGSHPIHQAADCAVSCRLRYRNQTLRLGLARTKPQTHTHCFPLSRKSLCPCGTPGMARLVAVTNCLMMPALLVVPGTRRKGGTGMLL